MYQTGIVSDLAEVRLLTLAESSKSDTQMFAKSTSLLRQLNSLLIKHGVFVPQCLF